MKRRLGLWLLALMAAVAPFAAQAADLHTWPVIEGGYGHATGAYGGLGLRVFGGHEFEEGHAGLLVGEAGARGARLRLGYSLKPSLVGVGINGFVSKGWQPDDRTQVGAELDVSFLGRPYDVVHGRLGVMTPITSIGRDTTVTWGVSVNVVSVAAVWGILHMACGGCQ